MAVMVSQSALLEHVIRPAEGDLPRALADYILRLDVPEADHARHAELSAKAQDGTLTEAERADLDDFLAVNAFLTILQSKARAALRRQGTAA